MLAPARHGGLERVVTMLASGQGPDAAHVVAVVIPGDDVAHPFIEELRHRGIPVTPLAVSARSYIKEYRALKRFIAQIKPRIIHTHGYHADVIGGLLARKANVPTVSTVHGFVGGSWRNRAYERIQLLALRRANAVVAVSRPLLDQLVQSGVSRNRVHLVPNAYVALTEILSKRESRARLQLPEGAPLAGWIGRLSREKGPDVMLEALALCRPPWRLSFIGDGRERKALEERAAQLGVLHRVVWHGALADAGSLITAFDAFVLSSRSEGTPIVLFEAMEAGVPIVATAVGGVPDVLTPREAMIVESESPHEIARALNALVSDQSATAERRERARYKVRERFSVGPWVAAVEEVYKLAELSAPDRRRIRADPD